MKEVRVGIVGIGFMGTTHFGIYRDLPGVKVAAIADVNPAVRGGDISSVVGNIGGGDGKKRLDLTGIEVFEEGFEMVKKSKLDMVDICVPTPFHADLIEAGLNAGLHVFCEKPLCRTLDQLKRLKEKLRGSDRYFNVGMCVRAWPEYASAKKILDSGVLGAVKTAHFRRLSPTVAGNSWNNWFMKEEMSGGAAYDLHLHDTDVICHLFGRPRSVASAGVRGVVSDGAYDQIFTVYNYGDSKLITAEGGWCAPAQVPFEMSFQIVCEKGTLKLDHSGYHLFWNDGRTETPDTGDPALPTGWHRELKYFTDCVREGIRPEKYQTPESVFDGISVATAEIAAADSGKSVEVEYV